jgi:ubiquinone/menaquinone biosynthesis C-methylase UbiE
MATGHSDKVFSSSISELYERYMVPLLFEPYAADLARRLSTLAPARLLEIAAGTGAVTRALASALPASTDIVATDLNQPMLDIAAARGTARPVEWRQADAMQLPFADGSFDAAVCQFGVMFFPGKAKAYAEARRVLRPGGTFWFNVWDRIDENECTDIVARAVGALFPGDEPQFFTRAPHGYFDRETIERDLAAGGFEAAPEFETVTARSRAASALAAATGLCQGSPLRSEIETRDPAGLARATQAAATALAQRFGAGPVDGKMQAHVIRVVRTR